jgi:hypothetical protein
VNTLENRDNIHTRNQDINDINNSNINDNRNENLNSDNGDSNENRNENNHEIDTENNHDNNENNFESDEPTVSNLYGEGKRYPEPYLAGQPPFELIHVRQQMKKEGRPFVYAVRFRQGPFGMSFDNKVQDATMVEGVTKHMQAETSGDNNQNNNLVKKYDINIRYKLKNKYLALKSCIRRGEW